jgi:hypothetical protein
LYFVYLKISSSTFSRLLTSDDPNEPTLKERAAEQRTLVYSFEKLKKTEDAAYETLQQRLLEDAAAHQALAAAWRAAEKQMRERRNDGAGPSGSK